MVQQNPYATNTIINIFNLKDDNDTKLKITYLVKKIMQVDMNLKPETLYATLETVLMLDKTLSSLDDFYFYKTGGQIKVETRYTFWPKKLVEYGVAKQVDAFVVREADNFEVEVNDDKMVVKHKSNPFKTDTPIIGVYARAVLTNGTTVFAFANKDELDAAKKVSRGNVWKTWELEMSKKVPLKRLMKLIPIPQDISKAIETDNLNYKDLKEIDNDVKHADAKEALQDLNTQTADSKKVDLDKALELLKIPFEMKNGYIKVEKALIPNNIIGNIVVAKEIGDYIVVKNTLISEELVVFEEKNDIEDQEDKTTEKESIDKEEKIDE